jgi:GH24 family phage-related lysozyme (muramidase)
MISRKSIDFIIQQEIGGRAYYDKVLQRPSWPGGESGITIGIGYDLGYRNTQQFVKDWGLNLTIEQINILKPVVSLKGSKAKEKLKGDILNVKVPYNMAYDIFVKNDVPRYFTMAKKIYPLLEQLNEDTQGSLVSMVFNRGTSLVGDTRTEMRAIVDLVANKDYEGIAEEIEKSKRLWEHKGLDGLVIRREAEADMIRNSV